MEHAPEMFGNIVMLYVNTSVNGVPIKAFIDTGAQMSIISKACAERCSLMRLVDPHYATTAVGVGTQATLGRIHMCQLQVAGAFLPVALHVMEKQAMDMIIGLDMLRRHQCLVDLRRNMLVIGTTGAETPFLTESELPERDRDFGATENPYFTFACVHVLAILTYRPGQRNGTRSCPSASGCCWRIRC